MSDAPQRSPTLAQVLDLFRKSMSRQLRVALPAQVQSYDASTQTVDVQPTVQDSFTDEDGNLQQFNFPVITNVPVLFPGGGGFRLTFPLQQGDFVFLMFSDRSLDVWQAQGGVNVDPLDERRHHIADAVAVPGLHPNSIPWTGASVTGVTAGKDGGPQIVFRPSTIELGGSDGSPPSDFVALASLVLGQLNAIVSSFNAHTHLTSPSGGPSGPPLPVMSSPSSVASAILKAE